MFLETKNVSTEALDHELRELLQSIEPFPIEGPGQRDVFGTVQSALGLAPREHNTDNGTRSAPALKHKGL